MSHLAQHPVQLLICLTLLHHLAQRPVSAWRRSCSSRRVHTIKECERFNKFLQNVLKAGEDFSWIDQVADQMRSNELLYKSPALQEKINSMFSTNKKQLSNPSETKNQGQTRKRHKRNPHHHTTDSPKLNPENVGSASADLTSRAAEHENTSPRSFNFTSGEREETRAAEENAIATATTLDPLEKVLQSINVFPVEEDPYASEASDDVAKSVGVTRTRDAIRDGSSGEGGLRIGRSLKSVSLDSELDQQSLKDLLSSNNVKQDKIQMDPTMQEEVAKEIVNAIFSQVENRNKLNKEINLQFNRHTKPLDTIPDQKQYLREMSSKDSYESDDVTKKLAGIVQQLVSNEVVKKSCTALPSDLQNFLGWLLENENHNERVDTSEMKENKLAENNSESSENDSVLNIDEWYKKAEALKSLLLEYEGLSKKEKSKVQAIHEYLMTRLGFVEAFIEAYKSHAVSQEALKNIHIN